MTTSTSPVTSAPGQGPAWHTLSIEDALRKQGVDAATGLSQAEAESRLKQYGPNAFTAEKKESGFVAFLRQYKDPMQILLLVAAIASLFIQQWGTALLLVALTLLNAFMGLSQEGKAEASVAALQKMMIVKSKVRRGGQVTELPAEQIVPGDIVLLEAGDRVTADGRIIRAATLEIGESALTGESAPVPKEVAPVDKADTPLGDRVDMAYMNTEVTRGAGDILVTATGMATEVGTHLRHVANHQDRADSAHQTAQYADESDYRHCPDCAGPVPRARLFSQWPEREHALTRRRRVRPLGHSDRPAGSRHLPAGSRNDSTRENRRDREATAFGRDARFDVSHQLGQDGHTHPQPDDRHRAGDPRPALHRLRRRVRHQRQDHPRRRQDHHRPRTLFLPMALAADAVAKDGELVGDPTEGALVVLADKGGIDAVTTRQEYPRVAEVPFDAAYKLMATFHKMKGNDGREVIRCFVKGAPDQLLARSSHGLDAQQKTVSIDAVRTEFVSQNERLGKQGLRVMAVARRDLDPASFDPSGDLLSLVKDLTMLALVGIVDPPRPEAKASIAKARSAGIQVRMITGDHAVTAAAIAQGSSASRAGRPPGQTSPP